MRSRQILTNFRAGVLSPNTLGLVGTDIYRSGLKRGLNIVVETLGGIKRRAGSVFVRDYGALDYMRIFPFTFNRDQAYIIVVRLTSSSTVYIDIYRDDILVSPDILTPYTTKEHIEELDFAQSADTMVFTQGDTPIHTLRRLGDNVSWDFVPATITNPPQYAPDPLLPDDKIDMWSEGRGYAQYCTFHQGRLWFAGSASFPQNVWASKSQDFFNFDLGIADPADSIQEALDTDFINPITAIFSARQLQVFTRGAEFNNDAQVLTSDTSNWVRQTTYGSAFHVPPLAVDGATLFVDSSGRTIRNFVYADERAGYDAPSVSSQAEHLVKEPQRMGMLRGDALEPANFIYIINIDGTIALLNLSKAHELLAWTEWTTQGFYRDLVTINREVYILVQRYVQNTSEYVTHNGVSVTHNDELVYYKNDPSDNVVLNWILERVSDTMLVDSGSIATGVNATSTVNINSGTDSFFGTYLSPDGRGKVVIVKDGVMVYKTEFLRDDPIKPHLDAEGVLYSAGIAFSYNEAVRELHFDTEVGYTWYMHVLKNVNTIDSGEDFIAGLTHLIGQEVVSTLDGNIQEPQIVKNGEGVLTIGKTYPDGSSYLYVTDLGNETYILRVQTSTGFTVIAFFNGVRYENLDATNYGYLIDGIDGTVDSVYLELGNVETTVIGGDVAIDFDTVSGTNPETVTGSNGIFTFTPPLGVIEITVCLAGSGGSGASTNVIGIPMGGGFAGKDASGSVTLSIDEVVDLIVGEGASAVNNSANGNAGSATVFGGYLSADGGARGEYDKHSYAGSGDTKTYCGGTYTDGVQVNSPASGPFAGGIGYGGEAGAFGDGGDGGAEIITNPTTKDGGVGAGGGGASNTGAYAGKGGSGRISIKWDGSTQYIHRTRKMVLDEALATDGLVSFPDQPFDVGQSGLFYPVIAETMPLDVSAGGGSLVNEPKRIVSVTSRFKDTQGVSVNGIDIPERKFGEEILDEAPPLLTGIEKNRHLGYNRETTVIISQNDPMPFTLLSIDVEVNY